jgi:hypothetical protein
VDRSFWKQCHEKTMGSKAMAARSFSQDLATVARVGSGDKLFLVGNIHLSELVNSTSFRR